MEQYKQEFIEFMVDCKVLKFGDFVTKSGRKTPFFINTGFTEQVHSLRNLANIMQRLLITSTEQILIFCSDLHIRVYRFRLPQL